MSLFDNDNSYNPLYLDDASGLNADFNEAVLEDDTQDTLRRMSAKKAEKPVGEKVLDILYGGEYE